MPTLSEISPAVTTPGPFALIERRFGPSTSIRNETPQVQYDVCDVFTNACTMKTRAEHCQFALMEVSAP